MSPGTRRDQTRDGKRGETGRLYPQPLVAERSLGVGHPGPFGLFREVPSDTEKTGVSRDCRVIEQSVTVTTTRTSADR